MTSRQILQAMVQRSRDQADVLEELTRAATDEQCDLVVIELIEDGAIIVDTLSTGPVGQA
jgi:hypothetical protein